MRQCPKCGSPRVHRSRSRGFLEQVRKITTSRRPHRCHACGWRAWGLETEHPSEPEVPIAIKSGPDLKVIDAVVLCAAEPDPDKTGGEGRHRGRRRGESL